MNLLPIAFVLLGFLSGSILYSQYLPWHFKRINIMEISEDHNPGTANVMKYAGVPLGIVCLVCDIGKGFVPVFLAMRFVKAQDMMAALILAAPVAGHAFSAFHRGRGGKAIAVTFGTLLGLWPDTQLFLVLCVFYLLFSVVIVIRPNERRTIFTFLCFEAVALMRAYMGKLPLPISLGAIGESGIVIRKNLHDAKLPAVSVPTKPGQELGIERVKEKDWK